MTRWRCVAAPALGCSLVERASEKSNRIPSLGAREMEGTLDTKVKEQKDKGWM